MKLPLELWVKTRPIFHCGETLAEDALFISNKEEGHFHLVNKANPLLYILEKHPDVKKLKWGA